MSEQTNGKQEVVNKLIDSFQPDPVMVVVSDDVLTLVQNLWSLRSDMRKAVLPAKTEAALDDQIDTMLNTIYQHIGARAIAHVVTEKTKEDTPDENGLGFLAGNEALTETTPPATEGSVPASVTAASAGDTPEADDQPASGSDDRE